MHHVLKVERSHKLALEFEVYYSATVVVHVVVGGVQDVEAFQHPFSRHIACCGLHKHDERGDHGACRGRCTPQSRSSTRLTLTSSQP